MSAFDVSRAVWRKSCHSGQNGDCAEVAAASSTVAVRDSKDRRGGLLAFTPGRWKEFTRQAKKGAFDVTRG